MTPYDIIEPSIQEYTLLNYPDMEDTTPIGKGIYYCKVSKESNDKLLKEVDRIKTQTLIDRSALAGDIKEEYFIWEVLSGTQQEFITSHLRKQLENLYRRKVVSIAFETSQDEGKKGSLWVNYMKTGEHNPLHVHGGLISFVWYLDVPENIRKDHLSQPSSGKSRGLIEFVSPSGPGALKLNPRTGDVFLFDAQHQHQVYPFYVDETRISMAGNIQGLRFEDGSELFKYAGKVEYRPPTQGEEVPTNYKYEE